MPWVKGQSGNPEGGRKRKIITDALMVALTEAATDGDRTKARAIADKLVAKALEGDIQAIKETLDRSEGKVATVLAGDEENPIQTITRHIVRPEDTDG